MEIPNKISLFDKTYKIIQCSKHDLTCKGCGEECIGKWDEDKKTIYVSLDDEDVTPQLIYLHELGHIFAFYYGLGKNEIIAEAFAQFVNSVLEQSNE